ncbi:MAG: hypothetical protein D6705_10525 [Deltaproteobacteria bacterium]|nr:MAG: hypothetical protein D6705_10525 [Deltaproteobacteria bacterium]
MLARRLSTCFLSVTCLFGPAACGEETDATVPDGAGTAADAGETLGTTGGPDGTTGSDEDPGAPGTTSTAGGEPMPAEIFLGANASPGLLCFDLADPCGHDFGGTDALRLYENGVLIHDYVPEFEWSELHLPVCQPIEGTGPEVRDYRIEVECGGGLYEDETSVEVEPKNVSLGKVTFEDPFATPGDTITLIAEASPPDLEPVMDLSVIDPAFDANAVDHDHPGPAGAHLLSYTLPANPAVPVGNYLVPVTFVDGEGKAVTGVNVPLTFLHQGPPPFAMPHGDWSVTPAPAHAASTLQVTEATFEPALPSGEGPDMDQFLLPDDGPSGSYWDHIELSVVVPAGLALDGWTTVELQSSEWDGHYEAQAPTTKVSCDAASCLYAVRPEVQVPPDAVAGMANVEIRVVDEANKATAWKKITVTNQPLEPGSVTFRGTVTVSHRTCTADPDGTDPFVRPQVCHGRTILPERYLLRIDDGCGTKTWAVVGPDGSFHRVVPTNCTELDQATVELLAATSPYAGRVAVARWVGEDLPQFDADLTSDPSDYAIHSATALASDVVVQPGGPAVEFGTITFVTVPSLTPPPDVNEIVAPAAVGAFAAVDVLHAGLAYFSSHPEVEMDEFPGINVLADPAICLGSEEKPCGNYGGFVSTKVHPGFIFVQNFLFQSPSIYAHELSHIFQLGFLRPGGYGRFMEPNANVFAYAILASMGIASNGWLPDLAKPGTAENMDFNGRRPITSEVAERPLLRPFFAAASEAAAAAEAFTDADGLSCAYKLNDDDVLVPRSEMERADCVMEQKMGYLWRVMFDLHDGAQEAPEPAKAFQTPGEAVTITFVSSFDGVQGNGAAGDPATHRFLTALLAYAGAKNAPEHPGYLDRGQAGLDLVDVLDAMVCAEQLDPSRAGDLLGEVHGYAYDFFPQAASACM